MKKILVTTFLITSFFGLTQEKTYYFDKAVQVGCSGANPLTDMTKKIKVNLDASNKTAVFSIASLNCSKDYEGINLGKFEDADVYFSTTKKSGVILEGDETLYLFGEKDGSYQIVKGAHTDKKTAKGLEVDAAQEKYAPSFSKIDGLVTEAKKDAELAEINERTLPIPEDKYSDEYGVSGIYYLSDSWQLGHGDKSKYVQAVNFEFVPEETKINIHLTENHAPEAYFHPMFRRKFKEGIGDPFNTYFEGEFYYDFQLFSNTSFYPLEKGVYIVFKSGYSSFGNSLDCTKPYINEKKDENGNLKFFLIAKDKNRMKELLDNPDEIIRLGKESQIRVCQTFNSIKASDNPMPPEGMKDPKLKADIDKVVKAYAAQTGWPQTILYSYIKGSEWTTLRHKISGEITGRSIRVMAIMKTEGGSCQYEEVEVGQNYDGVKYGKTFFKGNTQLITPVDCKEALKYQ